jgi:hypothetical protein
VTSEEGVRLVLRLWLAGAVWTGLLLGQTGSFILAGIGFLYWMRANAIAHSMQRQEQDQKGDQVSFLFR